MLKHQCDSDGYCYYLQCWSGYIALNGIFAQRERKKEAKSESMIDCLHGGPSTLSGKEDTRMGEEFQNSIEGCSVSPMIPLQPAKPVCRPSFSLSETGNKHGENGKDGTTGRKKAPCAGGPGLQDREVAKATLLFMDIPQPVVQLLMELVHASCPSTTTQQLYQLGCELLDNPARQDDLLRKHHCHQHTSPHTPSSQGSQSPNGTPKGAVTSTTVHATEDDRQKSPAGMLEESRRSASVVGISGTGSSFTKAAAVASECFPPEMGFSEASGAGCASLPKMSATAEDNQSPQKGTSTSSKVDDLKSDLKKTSLGQQDKTILKAEDPKSEMSSKELLQERVRRLARENWRLTQRKMCRACRKVELSSSGVTFLPCGHFITCEQCSEMFDDCPACGQVIMGTVRTFLS